MALTTVPVGTDTTTLARALVTERLAACVSVLPAMTSVYRWEGRVEEEQEHQIVIKTTEDRVPALTERVHALHPNAVPEWLVLRAADGSDEYLSWVHDSVTAGDETSSEQPQDDEPADQKGEKQ
ncbi:MAG: divalent-cation tolerance protein CutA [Acidobacteria bacterium]|nr:divalent-cation tolerance protein CutA [Acidobacteriota bacterium]